MSDFIQRQVSRAVGQLGPEVRPRLPSLFEPMRPEAAAPDTLALEADVHAELPGVVQGAPELAPPAPRHRAREVPPAPAREAGAAAPETRVDRALAEARGSAYAPDMRPAESVARPSLVEPPGAPHRFPERTARRTTAQRVPASPDVAIARADVPASVRALAAIRAQAPLAGAAAEPPGRPASCAEHSSQRSEAWPDSTPAAAALSWEGGAPAEAPLLVPPDMPAGAWHPRASSAHAARGAAADAVIEVTIGRIEVRAAPAPSGRAAQRPGPRPPSDLELYLRQKGTRRS